MVDKKWRDRPSRASVLSEGDHEADSGCGRKNAVVTRKSVTKKWGSRDRRSAQGNLPVEVPVLGSGGRVEGMGGVVMARALRGVRVGRIWEEGEEQWASIHCFARSFDS